MSETEMAKHLIEQDRLRKAGQIQGHGENGSRIIPMPRYSDALWAEA